MKPTFDRRQAIAMLGAMAAGPALAQKATSSGVTDKEIRIGQTMPYSGPVAPNSVQGKAQSAYFQMLNRKGGINGRSITFLSVDDGYSPPKTVEQIRKLVEADEVAFIFATLGTAPSLAVRAYLNGKKIPQLFAASGAEALNDPRSFPWTIPWPPSFYDEGRILGKYIAAAHPGARIAILYQNDDYGKNVVKGFKETLGADASSRITAEAPYLVTDPTVDSQIVTLMESGPSVLLNACTSKAAAQAARKIYELQKTLVHLVSYGAASGATSQKAPAGREGEQEFVMGSFLKDPLDPQFANDPAVVAYLDTIKRYYPEGNPNEFLVCFGYACAQTLEVVLRKCGDDLTRENILRQATSLDDDIPMLLPSIRVKTSATNYLPIRQMRLQRYDGKRWAAFGDIIGADR